MLAFDPGDYQKGVLARLAKQWEETGELPGKLARYGLDASAASVDRVELEKYLGKVAGYWQNRRGKGRGALFVKALLDEHELVETELLDPARLKELIRLEAEEDQTREREREDEVLQALEKAVGPNGVLPARSLDRLIRRLGEARRDEVEQVLTQKRWRVEEATKPTSEEVMKTIGQELVRLVRLEEADGVTRPGGSERLNSLSLYGFLGLMQDASDSAIRQALTERKAQQDQLGPTDRNTCLGNLIGQVDVNLLNRDKRKSYDIALVGRVADSLGEYLEQLVEGNELSPGNYRLLVSKAGEQGLTEDSAREAVNKAALDAEVFLTSPGPDPVFISCLACGISNPIDEAFCRECGEALKRKCPSCSSDQPKANSVCGKCGHDFEGIARGERLEAEAKVSLEAGRVVEAITRLKTALKNDPGRASLKKELGRLEGLYVSAENEWTEIEVAIRENRFHAVLAGISRVRSEVPDYPGSAANPIDASEAKAEDAVAEADRLVQSAASSADPDKAEQRFAEALALCEDCGPAQAGLSSIEPLPPSNPNATLGEGEIMVSWTGSKSLGPISYSVTVRDELGGVFETIDTKDLSLHHSLPAGTRGRYEVRAIRAGAISQSVETDLITAIYPVVDPAISPSESNIILSWKRIEGQRVRISRLSDGVREELEVVDDTRYEDRSVTLGQSYRYELTSLYEDGSTTLEGTTQRLDGRPVKRPTPVSDLSFETTADGLAITVGGGKDSGVEIFEIPDDWEVKAGSDLDRATYVRMGKHLPRAQDGRFIDPKGCDGGTRRYVAVALDGPFRVVGAPVDYVDLQAIDDLQITREGSVARLTWRWPDGVRQARILSRSDRVPGRPDDPSATVQEITLDRYQREGGVSLTCGEEDVHVTVFPMASIDSRPICGSSGASVSSDAADRKVTYNVEFTKRGKRLVVRADGDPPIPSLVIVGRSGSAPIQRASADDELTVLDSEQSEMTIELGKRRRPYFVRAFLENPADHPSVAVIHPSERKLRLE